MAKSIWAEVTQSVDPKQQNSGRIAFAGQLGTFVQQNGPVNNALARNSILNDLYRQISDPSSTIIPTEVTVRDKRGRIAPITSMCSFTYDDAVELEKLSRNGLFKITGYEMHGSSYVKRQEKFVFNCFMYSMCWRTS